MLGRVLSVDYGLALASESLSAVLAGVLQDNYGLNANQVSAIFAIVGFMVFGIWLLYRIHLSTSTKLQIEWEESLASLPALGDIGEREIMNKTTEKNNKI
jgi:hypothetical protein